MNANLLNSPTPAMARRPDLTRYLHATNIADARVRYTAEDLQTAKRFFATVKQCKGCSHSIGQLIDYCGECTSEDETDCW
jgi:hypothetical protein